MGYFRNLRAIIAAAILLPWLTLTANCAPLSSPCTQAGPASSQCDPVNSGNPLPVSGTFSATLGGFAPGGTFATLTATASSASVALPAGAVVIFQNTGTTAVSCTLGVGSATATVSQNIVQPASWLALTVGSNTFGACIDITGSTSNLVVLTGGAGLPTGAGGGGGSGGGGAVTNAGTFAVQLTGATNNINNIAGTISLPTGASTAANQATEIASLATIATNTGAAIPAGTATIGTTGSLPYPVGATPLTASATGTTAATTATLAGTSGKTTYICGYSIRANATAAATVTNTITGVITATLSSIMWVAPLASGIGIDEQIFSPCIPASATNTGIAIVSGAPGSGGTVSSKGWGYQL